MPFWTRMWQLVSCLEQKYVAAFYVRSGVFVNTKKSNFPIQRLGIKKKITEEKLLIFKNLNFLEIQHTTEDLKV